MYRKESIDVVSISLYLQGLREEVIDSAPEYTELETEDNSTLLEYKHLDDELDLISTGIHF